MNYTLIQKVENESNQAPSKIYLNKKACFIGRKFQKCLKSFKCVSREHAVFLKTDCPNRLFLVDLNSSDGTFVNSVKIRDCRKALKVGDIINFGSDETEGFTCILQEDVIGLAYEEAQSTNSIRNFNPVMKISVNKKESSKNCLTANINLVSNVCNEMFNSPSKLLSESYVNCNTHVQTSINVTKPIENCISGTNADLKSELSQICIPSTSINLGLNGIEEKEQSSNIKKSHSKNFTFVSEKCFHDEIGFPIGQLQMFPTLVLEKCDSPHFQWPSDVQSKPIGQLVDKDSFVHKRKKQCIPLKDSDSSDADMTNSFVEAKVIDSQTKRGSGTSFSKNKSKRIRIMSSDSENDDKELSSGFNKKQANEEANCLQIGKTSLIYNEESNLNFNSPLYNVKQELVDDTNILEVFSEGRNVVQDHDSSIENIEAIEKFVNGEQTETANFEKKNVEAIKILPDLILECSDGSDSNHELCVEENSSKLILEKREKIYDNLYPASKELKSTDKSIRKTLLIEPKPLKQRTCKLRGTKEFTGHQSYSNKESKSAEERKRLSPSKAKKGVNMSNNSDGDKVMPNSLKDASDLEYCFSNDNVKKIKAPTVKICSESVSSQLSNLLKDMELNKIKQTVVHMKDLHNHKEEKSGLKQKNADLLVSASQDKHNDSTKQNRNNSEKKHIADQTEMASKQNKESAADNHFEISFFSLMKKILQLQPDWLKQQAINMSGFQLSEHILSKLCEYPPIQVTEKCTYLPLHFESYHHYVSLFYPLIILEIWENIFRGLKEVFKSKNTYKFYFCIISQTTKNDYIELKCESIVNENKSYCPCDGCLVAMDIKVDSKEPQTYFGYIIKHEIKKLDSNSDKSSKWNSLPKEWLTGAKRWKFSVILQKKEIPFVTDFLMIGNGICNLQSKIGQVDVLKNMKNFALLDNILRPNLETFEVENSNSVQSITNSYTQMKVVDGIYSEIQSSLVPKIILVQGAPGTGKTHTIISLLEKLFFEGRSKKVLVLARSHAAVDVIRARLIDLNEQYNWKSARIDFVCIGSRDKVSKKMLPYLLDYKAKDLHNRTVARELKLNGKEGESTSKKFYKLSEEMRLDYYKTVLSECTVVLTTVNGIPPKINSLMCEIFKSNPDMHFSCCIVDESSQCTEVEILQPLVYDINKLILFADEKQLPVTVNSSLARTFGFERSLFQRFNQFFELHYNTKIFALKEQFRMHSEICLFPSKYVYGREQMYTKSCIDYRYKDFPLEPYCVLDILNSQELSMSSSNLISGEISYIENICKCLVSVIEIPSVIGIISLYSGHCSMYANALHQNRSYREIKIGTVNDFHGCEKDVIILSGIQTSRESNDMFASSRNLFNVALTRAKKCLILCCNVKLMEQNSDWKQLLINAKHREICFPVNSSKDIPKIFENNMKKYDS